MNDDCLKLTTYFGERQRTDGRFLAEALLNLYAERAVATSVMLRGIASFGPRKELRSDRWLSMSEDPPVTVAAVDARAKMSELVDDVIDVTPRGLITLERARLATGDLSNFAVPKELSEAAKLTMYIGRQERVDGAPAHLAICDLLYREGISGASVFLGVDGTARGQRRRAHFFNRNVDVPMMIISVGNGDKIAQSGAAPRRTCCAGPCSPSSESGCASATVSCLPVLTRCPMTDEQGRPLWQKLMVYTSEAALHDGAPIHRALVRQLRASQARPAERPFCAASGASTEIGSLTATS